MNMDLNSTEVYAETSAIEYAVLQQEINLPELPEKPLTLKYLTELDKKGKKYVLAERAYCNMVGNFYIPILFPLVEDGESTELEFEAPSSNNILNGSLKPAPYVERNYIQLVIPKYILMNFKDKIPKGTKFLIGFIGGSKSIENTAIIGLHPDTVENLENPFGKDEEEEY